MDELAGSQLREAITSEIVCDEIWAQLVDLAEPLLQTIRGTFSAYTLAFDEQDCQGILHDTFAQIVRKIDHYDPSRPFLPWARSIARNRVIDVLRDRTQQWKLAEALSPSPMLAPNERGEIDPLDNCTDDQRPEEDKITLPTAKSTLSQYTYEYGEDAKLAGLPKTRIFQQELSELSSEEQELIIEHWGNDIPLADLARRGAISDEAMRKRAERVRKKLYQRLRAHPEFADLEISRVKKSLRSN